MYDRMKMWNRVPSLSNFEYSSFLQPVVGYISFSSEEVNVPSDVYFSVFLLVTVCHGRGQEGVSLDISWEGNP